MEECILCRCKNVNLKKSHIVSKMFYNVIKKKSITGTMRMADNPNKGVQDGLKKFLLCERCEELFSKYETYFSNCVYTKTIENEGEISFCSKDDSISYFLLSIAWRVIIYTMKYGKTSFSSDEIKEINKVIENWRTLLASENMKEIYNIQQFIIPTKRLKFFQGKESRIWNNVGFDFKTFDKENSFEFAFTFVQVPYFIFVTTVWGKTDTMKQYKVGKKIKSCQSELPKYITSILRNNHYNEFLKAEKKLSDSQRTKIEERVMKNINQE